MPQTLDEELAYAAKSNIEIYGHFDRAAGRPDRRRRWA